MTAALMVVVAGLGAANAAAADWGTLWASARGHSAIELRDLMGDLPDQAGFDEVRGRGIALSDNLAAREQMRAEAIEEAEAELERVLGEDPDDADGWATLGRIRGMTGRSEAASTPSVVLPSP